MTTESLDCYAEGFWHQFHSTEEDFLSDLLTSNLILTHCRGASDLAYNVLSEDEPNHSFI